MEKVVIILYAACFSILIFLSLKEYVLKSKYHIFFSTKEEKKTAIIAKRQLEEYENNYIPIKKRQQA